MKIWEFTFGKCFPSVRVACVLLSAVLALLARPAPAADDEAARILADSGFSGGLVVQVGMRDASLALALGKLPNALVQGLVADAGALNGLRERICEAELYGRVSAVAWKGPHLPYGDRTVNLLLVLDEAVELDPKEIDRVLAPLGVVMTRRAGTLVTRRKAWPDEYDEWTHARYDSTGNAVSKDRRSGPPNHLQWSAHPRWNRGTKTSGMVSARGRVFCILDDGLFASTTSEWALLAHDAHNGLQLWRHPIPGWGGAPMGKKVGPAQVNRRLVAHDDRVYATLSGFGPVSVLDAATGRVLRHLDDTKNVEEFVLSDGVLLALVNRNPQVDFWKKANPDLRIVAVAPETGKLLWEHAAPYVLPLTMAADGKQAVYHDGAVIRSLDLRTGALRWESAPTGQKIVRQDSADADRPGALPGTIMLAPQFAPTLAIYGDAVAFAGGRQLNVVSAADGRERWRAEYAPSSYSVPVDLFGFDGLFWGPDPEMNLWGPKDDDISYRAWDPLTGALTKQLKGRYNYRFQHHRCYQMKVVGSTVLASRAGIEFLDTATGHTLAHHWLRGSCFYGVLPANGLLYTPPHNCACYVRAKLAGFMAFHTAPPRRQAAVAQRLEKGPAFGQTSGAGQADPDDWPTFRHDAMRSGRTGASVPSGVTLGWRTKIGSSLTAPVSAGGRVFLAETDAHALHALDAKTGAPLWQATFDGRIDAPPTVREGLVLCGCRDGSVYALRAADGALAWRFHAEPEERRIVSHGQLESVWPVPGNILVLDDLAVVSAGRTSFLDGGIRLYGLDPRTGELRFEKTLWTRDKDAVQVLDEEGVDGWLNDVLSSNGKRIFMRHQVLDLNGERVSERIPHLHAPDGFVSADTTERIQWTYGPGFTSFHQGAFYDQRLNRTLFPTGLLLVEDEEVVYGFGQNHFDKPRAEVGGKWALFSAAKASGVPLDRTARQYLEMGRKAEPTVRLGWWKPIPIHVRAMVKTKDILFVAGAPGGGATTREALDGKTPGVLLAVSPADGRVLNELRLPNMPVWDGMAAVKGKLLLALTGGEVVELREK